MTTLEKIRAEIKEESFEVTERSSGEQITLNYTVNVLRIIDKYAEQEPKWVPMTT